MIITLFVIGALTALGCGLNVATTRASWLHEMAWVLGGGIGAAMMFGAVYLDRLI